MLLFLCSRNIEEQKVIYSNLGESGKAVGTKLLLYWTLKGGEISYMEKIAFYLERLVNKIGKLLVSTSCRRILCNSRASWKFPHPNFYHLSFTSREWLNLLETMRSSLSGGCIRLLETCPNFMGFRGLKVGVFIALKQDSGNL